MFHLILNFRYLSKQCIPWSGAVFCGVWSRPALFANVPHQILLITLALRRHNDKNSVLPGFCLTRGLITLVNDDHVDNYLKEILASVYYWSIGNSRPKKGGISTKCIHLFKNTDDTVERQWLKQSWDHKS